MSNPVTNNEQNQQYSSSEQQQQPNSPSSFLVPPQRFASSARGQQQQQQQQQNTFISASSSFVDLSNEAVLTRLSANSGLMHLPPEEREGIITSFVNESERLRYEYDEVLEDSWYPQEPLMVDPEEAQMMMMARNYNNNNHHQFRNTTNQQQQQQQPSSISSGEENNNNNRATNDSQQQQQSEEAHSLLYTGYYGTSSNSLRLPSMFNDDTPRGSPSSPLVVGNKTNKSFFLTRASAAAAGAPPENSQEGEPALLPRLQSQAGAAITLRASQRHPPNRFSSYSIDFDTWKNLYLTISKRTYYVHLPTTISVLIGILLLYTFLLLTMGDSVAPGGELFDPIVAVIFSGVVGGSIALFFSFPPLVGILWSAIFWGNIANRSLVQGITSRITSPVKMLSLTMILLTGGLSINWRLVRPMKWSILLLATLPLTLDLVGNFLVSQALFSFESKSWAFLMSATLAPISASVVVASCIYIQSYGRGNIGGGPLIILLTAVPLESSIGIFIATFQQRLVLESSASTSAYYLAPLQILGGLFFGILAGFLINAITEALDENRFLGGDPTTFDICTTAEKEKFERKTNRRLFALILAVAGTGNLVAKHFELEGAGSLFVVSLGATLAHFWNKNPHTQLVRKKHISVIASSFWNLFALPALYTFVGVGVRVDEVFSSDFFWKGLCCFLSSVCCRLLGSSLISSLSSGLSNLSNREKIVLSIGFTGKASAQATLALMVFDKAKARLAALTPQTAEYDAEKKVMENGRIIANTSVIMILFAAPVCATLMRSLGKRWVRPDIPQ